MKRRVIALSCCIAMAAVLAFAQGAEEGYQMARVVAFEGWRQKRAAYGKFGTVQDSMRLGDSGSTIAAPAPRLRFLTWTAGKEFPIKVNGKVLLVKYRWPEVVEQYDE